MDRSLSLHPTLIERLLLMVKPTIAPTHRRIIWDFPVWSRIVHACVSQDKSCKFWGGESWNCIVTIKFYEAVSSCAFRLMLLVDGGSCAVGLENGRVYIMRCEVGSTEWGMVNEVEGRMTQSDAVMGHASRSFAVGERWS